MRIQVPPKLNLYYNIPDNSYRDYISGYLWKKEGKEWIAKFLCDDVASWAYMAFREKYKYTVRCVENRLIVSEHNIVITEKNAY